MVTAVNYEPTPDVRSFAAAIRRAGRRAQLAAEAKERGKKKKKEEEMTTTTTTTTKGGEGGGGEGVEPAAEETEHLSGDDPTRVPVSFFTLDDRFRSKTGVATVDASTLSSSGWFGAPLLWRRDDAGGFWTATPGWPPVAEKEEVVVAAEEKKE